MIGACFIILFVVGLISFYFRLKSFNSLPQIQSKAYVSFEGLKDGMSLSEVSDLVGQKARKVFNKNKYRWYFGDSIIVEKNGEIVSFKEFDKDIDHYRDYTFKRSPAYIEMVGSYDNLHTAVAVGLN